MRPTLLYAAYALSVFCLSALPASAQDRGKSNAAEPAAAPTAPDSIAYKYNYAAVEQINGYINDSLAASIRESLIIAQIASSDSASGKSLKAQLSRLRAADSVKLAARKRAIDSVKQRALPACAMLGGDTVMTIYAPTPTLSPQERAALYGDRVLRAAKAFSPKFDTLGIVDNGLSVDIVFGETPLINITALDAYWAGKDRDTLANAERKRVLAAVAAYKKSLGLWNVLRMVGLSIAVVAALVALFILVSRVFRKIIDRKIIDNREKWFRGIRFRNIEILTSEKLTAAALFVSKALRYALYLVLLYAALPMLFAIFPATRHLAGLLFSWIADPIISMGEGFVSYLPNLLRIAVIIIVMRYILKLLRYISMEIESGRLVIPKFYPDWARATFNLLRIFIYAFTVVLVFPLLPDSESSVFKGVSVFIGVLFSIGSSSVISNMMAGLVITYMRSFKIGDRIKVGDVYGDVVEKTLFVVRVQTIKKEVITVPNSSILSANVVNYSTAAGEGGPGVVIAVEFSVCYDVAWERAHPLLIEAALGAEHILPDPTPFVFTKELSDFAVIYSLRAYTRRPDLYAVICSNINRNVLDIFRREGIEMLVPQYRSIRNGEKPVRPE
ncbi:MAG: mechanosensitive ion channel family protein [Chitinispirillales bacterium]|jgi:small-conductance mechanosensitive channel|nr:mechanosensitive ion channel family protein [Chitinispirillales bacterium]